MYESPTETIKKVGEVLQLPIEKNSLAKLDSVRFELAEKKVEWGQLLAEKKNQMLHPKDKDLTELDRKTMLSASVAVIQKDYDFLCRLEELVDQRLQLGQFLLTLK